MSKAKEEEKKQPITWAPKLTKLEELRENPNNPKIINEVGLKRLKKSLNKFGLADSLIANSNGDLINGHSRKRELLELGVTEAYVSFPSRELTQSEYDELNTVYDEARAGDLDMFIASKVLEEGMLEEWDLFGSNEKRGKGQKNGQNKEAAPEAKYPLVAQYDEKYEAIVIVCTNSIDTIFIKNCLNIGKMMSYKNKSVKETSIITAKQFIKQWNEAHDKKTA